MIGSRASTLAMLLAMLLATACVTEATPSIDRVHVVGPGDAWVQAE